MEEQKQFGHPGREQKNILIDDRFIISKKLAKGSFGAVYAGLDTHNLNEPVVLKLNNEIEMNEIECNILTKLNN